MVQQAHSHWLASSFVQFSPYRYGIQNFLGDTFGGTVVRGVNDSPARVTPRSLTPKAEVTPPWWE